jgi:hypothetical protein
MIRIDRTTIGDIWRDQSLQMAICYVVLAVMFATIATVESQFRYLFLLVPVTVILAGVMTWMFAHSTDTIIIYDEKVTPRQPDHTPQEHDQELAWRVQDIIAGLGLIRTDSSIAGGWAIHIPRVASVTAGPPVGLHIRLLPGQTPTDFTARAPAIAYNLGVAEVKVVPLGPSLIRLDLLSGTNREGGEAAIPCPARGRSRLLIRAVPQRYAVTPRPDSQPPYPYPRASTGRSRAAR